MSAKTYETEQKAKSSMLSYEPFGLSTAKASTTLCTGGLASGFDAWLEFKKKKHRLLGSLVRGIVNVAWQGGLGKIYNMVVGIAH